MKHSTRRSFLQRGVALGAALSTPNLLTGTQLFGKDASSRPKIAAIGVGGSRGRYNQGGGIARRAAAFGDMIAVCDVDNLHTDEFNQDFDGKLNTYSDYRKLLEQEKPDVVTIGTPDHWHVPISIAALHSGCDVYCEKPLTLTIEEGFRIRDAVKETGKTFQVGTQQRSEHGLLFLKAVAFVQSGRLGENVNAYVAIGSPDSTGGPFETTPIPDGLDWNMWLGPAPKKDYCDERRKEFRWYYEYSGGKMTDWGAHHIDIAQWALGLDRTGPTSIAAKGEFPPVVPENFDWDSFLDGKISLPNSFNTAVKFNIDLNYANGATLSVNDHYSRPDGTSFPNGILFEGSKGRIYVNRDRLTGKPIEELTVADNAELAAAMVKLYKGKQPGNHMGNFFECIADGSEPISDVETHHRSMTSCHLCNIGLMLGRELAWNPDEEHFVDDPAADALMSRTSRPGFFA
ncbi:Gfo/Idh/MocA family protein [Bythopirellula polymerisocia]|uniref:Putative oxidoreductase YcjS n=1 Tax=Bythopirellula polymerisocia TaxID=2528003 RepID=A0A5C6CWM9_9BACT|nr:Gfo/Idh/MocA family oxidoreductase [Bythopirellula polymerisocia]TWU28134.1 putative oxidoreductase YcjS [Bythopirellula polymerisocia]